MVDLAKIRKKAKREAEKGTDDDGAAGQVGTTGAQPGDVSPAGATPSPEARRVAAASQPPSGFVIDDSSSDAAGTRAEGRASELTPATRKLERFKEEAGKRRAGIMGEANLAASQVAAEQLELLTFIIASEQYAIEIENIVEIVTPRAVTRIPNSGESIVGIISLRGTIVTLIDVRRLLRHSAVSAGIDTRVIVLEREGETMGFEVDRVLRVTRVDAAAVEPHPVVHASELTEAIRGVFRMGDALTILLNLDKLLDGRGVEEQTMARA